MNEADEYEIHAYVDGRLDDEHRAMVACCLACRPARAAEVEAWRHNAQHLRAVLVDDLFLRPNPMLDPVAVRSRRYRRRATLLVLVVVLFLCVTVGSLGGWQMHDQYVPVASQPMAEAIAAHRLFAMRDAVQPDLVSHHQSELQSWLDRYFQRPVRMPDLSGTGFHPVGGRLFATEDGTSAMVLYRNAAGHVISFYVRSLEPGNHLLTYGEQAEGGLLVQYGPGDGYGYAMVSWDNDAGAEVAARALQTVIRVPSQPQAGVDNRRK